MSVLAHFSVPADQFVLGQLLDVGDGVEVRLESMVPTGKSTVPYFWVPVGVADPVFDELRDSAVIEDVAIVDETASEALFRVGWDPGVDGLLEIVRNSDAVLLEAEGHGDTWSFRMRFPERDELSEFYQICIERGFTPELEEVNGPYESGDETEFGVSPAQREALLTALNEGYFDVPRESNLTDLAAELDISDTAASQRIRRGISALLRSTIAQPSERKRASTDDD